MSLNSPLLKTLNYLLYMSNQFTRFIVIIQRKDIAKDIPLYLRFTVLGRRYKITPKFKEALLLYTISNTTYQVRQANRTLATSTY